MEFRLRQTSLLIAALLVAIVPAASAQEDTRSVLVLYSTSRDSPMASTGDRDLRLLLERGLSEPLAFFTEYIDQGRFPERGYQAAFSNFLRVKYRGQPIDLLIAIQPAAVQFVNERRDELFPGTPVVFLAFTHQPKRLANSTGVVADLNLAGTIDLALQLQPDVRNVFVVSGTAPPDKEYERVTRQQLRPFESKLAVTYLSGLPTGDLEKRLAGLPDRSIVYYLAVYRDGAGEAFSPSGYAERVAASARAPTYTWSDALMGSGVMGGSLLDRAAMMEAVGQISLRVLGGEKAEAIPVESPDLHVNQIDWRQLRRWGIAESRVPAGTRILFRQPTFWDLYKTYIVGAAALLLAQTALIGGLLIQRGRRRQAEALARGSQAQLRASYERIHDLGGRLLNAQESERARIARELHDDISQQVALLEIDLEQLGGAVEGAPGDMVGEALTRAQSIARSVHDLSHQLHPARLRLIGLVSALQGLQREMSQSGLAITFSHDNVPSALPQEAMLCLFRVVQEALQNAIKYSGATEVSVRLSGAAGALTLTVADNGAGFDVDAAWGKGLGLISMGERVEAIGGTFKVHSRPGAGTRLEATVPLPG
jgi:signal transduction histidine kinase